MAAHIAARAGGGRDDDSGRAGDSDARCPSLLVYLLTVFLFGAIEESSKEAIESIRRNADIQRRLIDDLLDVSRIAGGKLRVDRLETDLVTVIEDAIGVVAPSAQARGIRLHAEFDWDAGSILGDPERLQQVFWNLLSNAVKFTPEGGRIDVRLGRLDSWSRLSSAVGF